MPLVSCDDPKGARFSVVGKTGRCEVVIDRAGRPNFGFVANDDNEAAQVEEMMSRMSLRRCDPNVTVVVSSDEEDELAQFVTPPVTPARSRTKKTGSPAQRGGAAASSFVPSNQPRAAVFAPPSPAHMYVPATPGNTPATTISSPSSLGPLSPLIFADAPVPDVIPAHPTAPSYIGIGPFNPDAWGVPLVWSRRYAAPWLPTPKCGKKWHVVRIGFEIGTVSNPSFVSPEKIVVMVKLAMLAFGISLRLWSTGAKAQSVDRAIPSPASSYCVLFSIVIVIRGSLLLNMEINCVGVHICGSVVRPTLTLLSPRTVEDDDNDGPAPDCGVSTPAESDSYTGTAVLSSSDNTNINDNGEPTLDCGVDWRRSLLAPLAFLKITFNTAKAYLIKSSSLMAALGADCATTALSTKDSIDPIPPNSRASEIVEGFTVIDVSGIHIVDMGFCRCYQPGMPGHRREQLLRHGLFPATLKVPQAAFTFDVLDTFHKLTLQSKIAAYDFYRSLERKTDSADIQDLPDYYERFLDVMRAYRNLMAAKRSGRAHDPSGVKATAPGQCAVECPACPHPGRNLPEGWENATDHRWLYSLIVTMDANFRLKNRDRAVRNDTSLGDGWGHWVPSVPFLAYVQAQADDLEPNLCDSQWRAIDQANTKRSSGYTSTGVGGVICGRHGLVRRNGFGDLQKARGPLFQDPIVWR
ncbi:hypothetical protein EYR38_000908 [Pleurotus pulmonarius]|nr:hypothetical protein EYR38_000908 [Pleurotus pulmonarius]